MQFLRADLAGAAGARVPRCDPDGTRPRAPCAEHVPAESREQPRRAVCVWSGRPGPGRCWVQEGGVSGQSLSSWHMSADAQLRALGWSRGGVGQGPQGNLRLPEQKWGQLS